MSVCKTNLTNTQIYCMNSAVRQKKKTNQKTCIHFDTVYSPALPPTHPTYTIHLHTSPAWNPLLAQTDSSDTFYSFVLSFGTL